MKLKCGILYIDALEALVEGQDRANELSEQILAVMSGDTTSGAGQAAASSGGTQATSDVAGSIEAMVKSINEVDKEKAGSIVAVVAAVNSISANGATESNAMALSKSISSISNAINGAEIDRESVENVMLLSQATSALIKTSMALALASPILLVGIVGAFLLIPLVWSLKKAFGMLDGEAIENMEEGAQAIRKVGFSILLFAGSIALAGIIMGAVFSNPMGLLLLIGVMGLSALTMAIIGKNNDNINKGSLAVLFMALSLWGFSFAISQAHENIQNVGISGFGMLMLTMGGTAIMMFLAGKFLKNILFGALAFAAIGIALWLLSIPLETIAGVIGENSHILWQLPVLLTAIGGIFALAGIPVIALAMLIGSAAFAAVGLSLMTIGFGLQSFAAAKDFDAEHFKEVITGVKDGIMSISLVEALTIPLRLPAILTIAAAMGTIALGLMVWKVADWSEKDSVDFKAAMEGIVGGILSISVMEAFTIPLRLPAFLSIAAAMASLGIGLGIYRKTAKWTKKDSEQFKMTITSFVDAFTMDVDWDDIDDAIDATYYLGGNLENLAEGIKAWEDIDFDLKRVHDNISMILNTIPFIFAAVGKADRETDTSLFGWGGGDVERGIESTEDMGNNLVNLAEGIKAWEEIDFDLVAVKTNIESILNTIPFIFAAVGKADRESDNSLFGWGGGDVERGIEASLNMGENLTNLAEGIKAWEEMEYDKDAVTTKITEILTTIPDIFATIGNEARKTEGWFSDSDVEKGVEIAGGFSEPLMGVADVITAVSASLVSGADTGTISDAIVTVFGSLARGIGMFDAEKIALFAEFIDPFQDFSKALKPFNKNMKETAEILAGMDDNMLAKLSMLGEAFKGFAEVKALELKNTNISKVTSEVVHSVGSLSIPKAETETATLTKTAEDGNKAQAQGQQQLTAVMNQILAVLNQIDAGIGENGQDLEQIKGRLAKTLKVQQSDF